MRRLARKRIVFAIIWTMFVVVVCGGIEFAARWWLMVNTPATVGQYRFGFPAAYRHSPYFNDQFKYEQAAFAQSFYFNDDGMLVSDFHGKFFNHDGQVRRTTDQPINAAHTLYFIGTSTALNIEVPDTYTIASYLQRLMPEFKVVNLGTLGTNIRQHIVLLKKQPIKAGDIVIFLDGIGNAGTSILYHATPPQQLCANIHVDLGTIRAACSMLGDIKSDPATADTQGLANEYRGALKTAYDYVTAQGATFWHFLNPVIWSEPFQSKDELYVWNNPNITPLEIHATKELTWPTLQAVARAFPNSYDLTNILDDIRKTRDIYLDYDHVTEAGNERIAAAIAARIVVW